MQDSLLLLAAIPIIYDSEIGSYSWHDDPEDAEGQMDNPFKLPLKQVLVLEDSGLVAMEIEMALRDAGANPVRVDSVAAALDAVYAQRFDCALLNFHLPDGTCAPVAVLLKEQDCPVAIVSGGDARHIEGEIGKFPFFRKPVDARRLAAWASQVAGIST